MRILLIVMVMLIAGCPQPENGSDTANASGAPQKQVEDGAHSVPNAQYDGEVPPPGGNFMANLSVAVPPELEQVITAFNEYFVGKHQGSVTYHVFNRDEMLELAGSNSPDLGYDVVIFADNVLQESLIVNQWINDSQIRTFAGDRLVMVNSESIKVSVGSVFDVAKEKFTCFGLLASSSLSGYFGDQAIISDGLKPRIESRIRGIGSMAELQAGIDADEVQVSIVTASTAPRLKGVDIFLLVDEGLHEDIRYRAAIVRGTMKEHVAEWYVSALAEDPGAQELINSFGLVDRTTALEETT